MSTRINHNLLSLNAQRSLWTTQLDLDRAVQRLSSGLRINYAWDDPTGLGISERLRASISAMAEAEKNADNGKFLTYFFKNVLYHISPKNQALPRSGRSALFRSLV